MIVVDSIMWHGKQFHNLDDDDAWHERIHVSVTKLLCVYNG